MTNTKILNLEELAILVDKLKKQGKTVAHCHGCFDLLVTQEALDSVKAGAAFDHMGGEGMA